MRRLFTPFVPSCVCRVPHPAPPGDVVVVDLASASDLTRQRMDPAGVRAVRYTQGGLVAALGQSNAGQLLLWDPRTAPGSSSGGGISGVGMSCHQRPLVSCSRGLGVTNRDSFLTCLETHPCHEHEFYCGTSTGNCSSCSWEIASSSPARNVVCNGSIVCESCRFHSAMGYPQERRCCGQCGRAGKVSAQCWTSR